MYNIFCIPDRFITNILHQLFDIQNGNFELKKSSLIYKNESEPKIYIATMFKTI